MTGRQRTSDAGFKLARLMQANSLSNVQVRELLLMNASEHGLQNWMFAVLQMFDGIEESDIRTAAEKSGVNPSPFVPGQIKRFRMPFEKKKMPGKNGTRLSGGAIAFAVGDFLELVAR